MTIAAAFSLVAIVEPLATMRQVTGTERTAHFALAAITLINSWILVPTMFTTRYADMFYSANQESRPLHFPETPMPVFWDFAYFSFTIAVAVQTSDVCVMTRGMRKLVLAHSVLNFFFNLVILGLSINIAAGLINS